MKTISLTGLVAATHTPFQDDGGVNLATVEKQAAHLLQSGIKTAFISGSTGECHSLSLEERRLLTRRWMDVSRGSELRIIVHVGSNCLADARHLAAQAQELGALAISALAPSYFKPRSLETLLACCAEIAGAAPETPFYFYDIPVLTGVALPMPQFLVQARERIPTFAGIKFTNPDLMAFQVCLRTAEGASDVLWGNDEYLLAALALGGQGAVGSTYNFAAPVYQRLWQACQRGDLAAARAEQFRSVQLIRVLAGYGYMAAAKALMTMLGVNVGPARLPNDNLTPAQSANLRRDLEQLGFFEWIER